MPACTPSEKLMPRFIRLPVIERGIVIRNDFEIATIQQILGYFGPHISPRRDVGKITSQQNGFRFIFRVKVDHAICHELVIPASLFLVVVLGHQIPDDVVFSFSHISPGDVFIPKYFNIHLLIKGKKACGIHCCDLGELCWSKRFVAPTEVG